MNKIPASAVGLSRSALANGQLSRRYFLGVGGIAALSALTACTNDNNSPAGDTPAGDGPFTWEDGRGEKISIDTVPQIVVAQSTVAASLWDAGFRVTGVYGELGEVDGSLNYQAGNIDLSEMTVLGQTYGEFNLEKYAALGPELLVDLCFDGENLFYVPADSQDKILPLAPTLAMEMLDRALPETIEQFMTLAEMLGADIGSDEVVAAKTTYDEALAEIEAATAAKPNLRVVAVSREADKLYFADAAQHPDLRLLTTSGVNFPDVGGEPGEYFLESSWELAGTYPADIIIYDAREPGTATEAVANIATWTSLPAVQAGQVFPWYPAAPYSYAAYGPLFAEVAGWLASSEPLEV